MSNTGTQSKTKAPKADAGLTLSDLRSRKKPNTIVVSIVGDSVAAGRLEEANERLNRAERILRVRKTDVEMKEFDDASEAVRKAKAEVAPSVIEFSFRAIGTSRYDQVVNENLWTEPSKKKWREENLHVTDEQMEAMPPWDPEKFPLALIAESMAEPKLSHEEIIEWLQDDTWNNAEIMALFQAALEVNNSRKVVELGKG